MDRARSRSRSGAVNPTTALVNRAVAILRSLGTGAHAYIPGVGTIRGLVSGNFQDSTGTTPATVGSVIGLINDAADGVSISQTTTADKPLLKSISDTVGCSGLTSTRIFHDMVSDHMHWDGTTGDYWIYYANISGVFGYQTKLTNAAPMPVIDYFAMIVTTAELTGSNLTTINSYLALWRTGLPTDRWVFECNGASYTGRGGTVTSGTISWVFGSGATRNTMFSDTVATTARELLTFDCNDTALTDFRCYSNQLTGSIPSLTANTALTIFYCYSNQLTGSIPSLTANTALTLFYCHTNQLTGSIPSLTANTALTQFYCYTNQLTGWTGGTVSATLGDFRAHNNLLTQAAVDAILAAFVAAGRTTGTRVLNLGGTGNATPSAAGLADKATLVSRGWTVTTN